MIGISNTFRNLFLTNKNKSKRLACIILLSFLLLLLPSCRHAREDLDATNATLAYLENTYGAVNNPTVDVLLNRISQRLVAGQSGLRNFPEYDVINIRRTAKLPWQIYVIGDKNLNAFAIGSGILVVTKGMILSLDTEAKLAAVIAHEMAHELLDHTTRAMAAKSREESNNVSQQYHLSQEIWADRLSALLLHSAGYPPSASIDTLVTVEHIQPQNNARAFSRRVNALKAKVSQLPQDRPYINNTRQFNRARRLLNG